MSVRVYIKDHDGNVLFEQRKVAKTGTQATRFAACVAAAAAAGVDLSKADLKTGWGTSKTPEKILREKLTALLASSIVDDDLPEKVAELMDEYDDAS